MKKFRPPLLRRVSGASPDEPPPKKQRVAELPDARPNTSSDTSNPPPRAVTKPTAAKKNPVLLSQKYRPVAAPVTPAAPPETSFGISTTQGGAEGYYNVLWRKSTAKKHKTWDGDGILAVSGGYAVLQDISGQNLGKTMLNRILESGDELKVGGKDIEIDSMLSKKDFLAGKPFLPMTNAAAPAQPLNPAPHLTSTAKIFKTPLLSSTIIPKSTTKPMPRHDPEAENSLVMPHYSAQGLGSKKQIVDVVVDPYLSQHLRPHQREGVTFLYECVMRMKPIKGQGAILADEMGLGKTLQTIALLWTLLKQNPIYGDQPVVKKALVVCPVTLINNWRKEFHKWLGNERISVFVADSKANLRDFTAGKIYNVMIIGYEKLQKVHTELQKANIDIVVADEGHRLKTEKNKSAQAIRALNTPRRIILSGTPLQNDLHEFFIMVDFVNPGLLESYSTFRKQFENHIVKSRQPGASKSAIELGKSRADKLTEITALMVLRRTAEILSEYLPPKKEYVIFCRPTSRQLEVYRKILESSAFQSCLQDPHTSLLLITVLKKLCNTPGLLLNKDKDTENKTVTELLSGVDPNMLRSTAASTSGKLRVLSRILGVLKESTDEKIVLVSNYTRTLDVLQSLLCARGLSFLRLDGSTPNDKRQELVDRFNKVDANTAFAFLLSAKSGGAGINLIGASRLILFDLDWNPATDAQAMARIHRDGQKREVKIYRMLTTGCFDEKIYQRQLTKRGLADSIVDNKASSSAFTLTELQDLFSLNEETECLTHDLLACKCDGRGYVTSADITPQSVSPLFRPENDSGDENDLDGDDDLPDPHDFRGLIKASLVTKEIVEGKAVKQLKEDALGALMEYEHVATRRLLARSGGIDDDDSEDAGYRDVSVEDEVLMEVLCEEGKEKEVTFVFQKSS